MQSLTANGDVRYRIKQLPRSLGFDKGFYVCVRALQLLVQHNQGCVIVAVAGVIIIQSYIFVCLFMPMLTILHGWKRRLC